MTTGNDWTGSYTFMYLNSNPHFDWWMLVFNKMILRQSSWRCSQMLSRFFFKGRWHFILVCALLLMAVLLRCQYFYISPKATFIWNIISISLVFNIFQRLAREQWWFGKTVWEEDARTVIWDVGGTFPPWASLWSGPVWLAERRCAPQVCWEEQSTRHHYSRFSDRASRH